MRCVLDANVVISAFLRPQGPPGMILRRFLGKDSFDLVASAEIIDEIRETMHRPKIRARIGATPEEIDVLVEALARLSLMVAPKESPRILVEDDPDDGKYVSAALEAGADFLVTGDRHLLDLGDSTGIRIITPRAFLEIIGG